MKHPTHQTPHSSNPDTHTSPADDNLDNSLKLNTLTHIPEASTDEVHHRLILTLEGKVIREYEIEGHGLSIGRRHGNDIQINDLTLSGRHAQIFNISDNVYIEDLDSTNGTLVNGCHIKKVALEHGDIIQIGHHQLTYLCENNDLFIHTMFIKAEHDESSTISSNDFDKTELPKRYSLGGFRTVGKKQDAPAPVMELRKSRNIIGVNGKRMALVTRGSGGYSITAITGVHNRRASDIPMVNGKQMGDTQIILQPGDIVSIAGHDVQFNFLD